MLRRLGDNGVGQGRNPSHCAALDAAGINVVNWTLPGAAPQSPQLAQVDTIVHCAGRSSPFGRAEAFHAANVLGTASVLNFARLQGVKRFVFISSPSIYFILSDQLDVPEDMPLPPAFTPMLKVRLTQSSW